MNVKPEQNTSQNHYFRCKNINTKITTMAKKKVQLASLGTQHIADHLAHYFPFLRTQTLRVIHKHEVNSEKVFTELFGGDHVHFEKNKDWLNALYTYQQCNTKTKAVSTTQSTEALPSESQE